MKHEALIEVLDAALERLWAGEAIPALLAAEPEHAQELAPLLQAAGALALLRPVAEPPLEVQQADRAFFLAAVATLNAPAALVGVWVRPRRVLARMFHRPVDRGPGRQGVGPARLPGLVWLAMSCAVAVGLAGGVLLIARGSLPGSFLYPLKLTAEEARLQMATDGAARAGFYLAQAQTRADELEAIGLLGGVPDPAAVERMEASLKQAISLADQLPSEQELDWLSQAHRVIQIEEVQLADAELHAVDAAQPILHQAHTAMSQMHQRVESELSDPANPISE